MPRLANGLSLNYEVFKNSIRTAVAAVASMLVARLLKMPEFYWAPISTIVILLSTIPPLALAWQRFAGTAVGAALGAALATYLHPTWLIYGAGIMLCGVVSALVRLGPAYRFAAIALTIVLLVPHSSPPWIVGLHRFIEVSVGIAVALVVTEVWPLTDSPQSLK